MPDPALLRRVGCLVVAVIATVAGRPSPAQAQSGYEVQLHAVGTFGERRFLGAGAGVAYRPAGSARVGLALSAGARDSAFAGRGELVASYHLNPYQMRGVAPYAGGGVAVGATSEEVFEYVVLFVGVETTPGAPTGWFAELGIGGGVRAAAGFRIKRRAPNR